jgi:hypothetical protein
LITTSKASRPRSSVAAGREHFGGRSGAVEVCAICKALSTLRLATNSAPAPRRMGSTAAAWRRPAPRMSTFLPAGLAQVDRDVAHQAHAVEVLGPAAIAIELEGIGRTGGLGAGRQIGGVGAGVELERHGHVQAAAAGRGNASTARQSRPSGGFDPGVDQCWPVAGKLGVDQRGLAVGDRLADHRIAVGGSPMLYFVPRAGSAPCW